MVSRSASCLRVMLADDHVIVRQGIKALLQQDGLASLRVGVRGYVLKNNAALNLLQAIEAVMQGQMYFSPGVSGALVQAYLDNAPPSDDPLSPREREVLQLIAAGKTMKEIGGVLGINVRTAESHRARIMSKLQLSDVAGLVRYAISHGLITVESVRADDPGPPPPARNIA